MNEKIFKIMALALEIAPYNENRAYTSKPRVKLEYSSDFSPTLKLTVTKSYKGRINETYEVITFRKADEKRLDEVIEWLESVKAEG